MKSTLPLNCEAFFLDFDGVVVESADIKTQAFYDIYSAFGHEIAEKGKAYHLLNQGISRKIKFREIHKKFLNQECNDIELEHLSQRFSEVVFNLIVQCPLVEGVEDFLQKQLNKKIPVFLLSATPHDELISIVKVRRLHKYFKKIFGYPNLKHEAGAQIIDEFKFNPHKIIFIGDSDSDLIAAQSIGSYFIGRICLNSEANFKDVPTIINFSQL